MMRGTHPERSVEHAVERSAALARGERVLIACSGGSDSVGLAAIVSALAKRMQLSAAIAHVNHGLRDSAWQDEAVVLRAGAALNLRVKIAAVSVRKRDEATLRSARYAALADLARELGCSVVATGHTADDQTETVLLALFRGTGPQGLSGMPERRSLAPGLDLARPLLQLDRQTVRSYVQQSGLPYAVDPTNADKRLRRNAVREALAALRPAFPGLDEAVARAAHLVRGEVVGAPQAALRRHVRETLRRAHDLQGVDFSHVEAAVRALERGRSGRFTMGAGLELTIENGELTVHRR